VVGNESILRGDTSVDELVKIIQRGIADPGSGDDR